MLVFTIPYGIDFVRKSFIDMSEQRKDTNHITFKDEVESDEFYDESCIREET